MININDSVLNSTKKLLGIMPEEKDFDQDIIAAINASIFTLSQLGLNTKDGITVYDETTTFSDLFKDCVDSLDIEAVRQYIYIKTRIAFDPPQVNALAEMFKEQKKELEWRLRLSAEQSEYDEEQIATNITQIPNETIKNIWDDVMEDDKHESIN